MADDSAGRRRLSPNLIAGLVLAILAIAVVGWQQPWKSTDTTAIPETPTISTDAGQEIAAQIGRLDDARTQDEFIAAAGDTDESRAWSVETFANLRLLGVTDRRIRFIRGGEPGVRTDGATEATVEVSWKPGASSGLDPEATKLTHVTLVLDPAGAGKFAIRDAESGDGPMPLWLTGKVGIDDADGARVFTIDGGNPTRETGLETARAQKAVREVVPSARSELIVISPRTDRQAAALLGRALEDVGQIAAVTTTLDGAASSSVVIILNPAVFETMDARAGQIVMTHEATHLLTEATTAQIDEWVGEGFADFVALHDDTAPLTTSAGQILRSVREDGPPKALPAADDFGTTQHGLGGTYESAWMVFRMLGERYSDRQIVTFYQSVLDGTATSEAVETTFGISLSELTRDWQDYLEKSASIGS